MGTNELYQAVLYFAVLFGIAPFLGRYIAYVYSETRRASFLAPIEKFIYTCAGINPQTEMRWTQYAWSIAVFSGLGLMVVYLMQIMQGGLPLNPERMRGVHPLLALNTAVSFVTNTNWQAYSGESTLSYLVQAAGLTVQNFLSASTGMAVMAALARGIVRREAGTIGNFWVDMVRTVLYILLPLSVILAVILMSQGVVQTFGPYEKVQTLSGAEQIIPLGPAASQIAIKQIGTNGGGFFGVNSAHPFENPTPLSNFIEMLSILLIPAAQVFAFGRMIRNRRHGFALFSVMAIILVAGFLVAWYSEAGAARHTGVSTLMEGKETRFGVMNSVLWETATTAASNGSVNAMHDSMSPLAILVAFLNIMLGEVVFGGVGSGLYGMVAFALLTIFLVGLMVGRTPEYLGKKIEGRDMRWTMAIVLILNLTILVGSAVAVLSPAALSSTLNKGPHGLSEIVYAFASAVGNNGSALAGLSADTPFYNIALSIAMLLGRFGVIVPVLAIAGNLARKRIAAYNEGSFRADNPTFAVVLLISVVLVAALTFVPMLMLGPVAEHVLLVNGRLF
jgi:potassium-transporting ATPase potassium-binding subunit